MGTGKTKVAIDEMCAMWDEGYIDAVIVIAPKGSYMNWINSEFPTHMPDCTVAESLIVPWRAGGGTKAHQALLAQLLHDYDRPLLPILVMNVEALSNGTHAYAFISQFVMKYKKIAIYVDESTSIRSPGATRTKRVIEIGRRCLFRRIMSGFAAPNSPLDLYCQFEFLGTKLLGFSSYYAYRARYSVLRTEYYRGRRVPVVVGYRDIEDIQRRIEPHSFRVIKDECLDLPPKIYSFWDVEMTDEQRRIYSEIKENATATLGAMGPCPKCQGGYQHYYDQEGIKHEMVCNVCGGVGELAGANVTASAAIVQILRLHQVLCGHVTDEEGKIHDIPTNRPTDLLEILQETPYKTIIWARFRRDLDKIGEHVKKEFGEDSIVRYDGSVAQADREIALERFQQGNARFFEGNPAVAGFGLTLTAARSTVYYSNSYDLEQRMQSEDRPHRIGQKHPHNYVDMRCVGTIEEKIVKALRAKINIGTVLMGDGYKEWLI
jgi:hypothetical protein